MNSFMSMIAHSFGLQRILKGHPNIVHLIDAAWHRLSNGNYEVFILMEFCPGSQRSSSHSWIGTDSN